MATVELGGNKISDNFTSRPKGLISATKKWKDLKSEHKFIGIPKEKCITTREK